MLLVLSCGPWICSRTETVLLLHHEQHSWDDEARVGRVAEKRPHESRQVQVYGFHDHVEHLGFPAARSQTWLQKVVPKDVSLSVGSSPEGSAVKRRRESHDGVDHGQQAEEEDEQQKTHVEVIGLGGLEHSLMRDVCGHHGPTLVVHGAQEAEHVDADKPGGVKRSHPK